jgi:hypothetical protein
VGVGSGKVSSVTMASGGLGGAWDEFSLVESFLVSGGGGGGGDDNFREAVDGGLPDGGCGGTGAGSTLIMWTSSTDGADLVPYLLVDDRARGEFFNVARI